MFSLSWCYQGSGSRKGMSRPRSADGTFPGVLPLAYASFISTHAAFLCELSTAFVTNSMPRRPSYTVG